MAGRRPTDDFIETFGAVRKRISALAAQAYAEVDIAPMQARLVRQIGNRRGITQAGLARATNSDPTLTGRVLQGLIQRGLVRRERSTEDRREYLLELTAAGRRVHTHVERVRAQLGVQIGAALDAVDRDDFARIAAKILAATE